MRRILKASLPVAVGTMLLPLVLPAAERPTADTYRRLAEEVEEHWKKEVLGVWFPRCIDKNHGGFFPHFLEDWSKGTQNDKTIVFQARMTWVCAQVAMRYPDRKEEFLGYTRHGTDLLAQTMWDSEQGGFYWGLDETGKPSKAYGDEKHVYGVAFGIYSLAAAHEATGERRALELAKQAFAWLEQHAHDETHGGYYEALTRDGRPILAAPAGRKADFIGTAYGYKSMNTHIHVLEALTELFRVWPDAKVRQRLAEVFALVRDRIAVEPGCLNLFFTPDWRALPDHDSFGHDIETAYLLEEAAAALKLGEDAKTARVARSLVDHALVWGWDDTLGGFYDKGSAFAPAWAREKIWWTQAEGLNSLLLMHQHYGHETSRYFDAFQKQWNFILRHQADRRYGEWYERVAPDGNPEPRQAKGTVWKAAYHNGRALMNVAAMLRALARGTGPPPRNRINLQTVSRSPLLPGLRASLGPRFGWLGRFGRVGLGRVRLGHRRTRPSDATRRAWREAAE